MAVIFLILKPTQPQNPGLTLRQQLAKIDIIGQLCLLPCIICLLLALTWGGTTYTWGNWRIILLFTLFGVLLVAFVLAQIFQPKDVVTIPGSIVKNRSILAAMWLTLSIASTMMIMVYYLPIWFQAIKGVLLPPNPPCLSGQYANPHTPSL